VLQIEVTGYECISFITCASEIADYVLNITTFSNLPHAYARVGIVKVLMGRAHLLSHFWGREVA
jgi:hypothetical protein